MEKLIAENQLVGIGDGSAVFRNLYEDANGKRRSVDTSRRFDMQAERTLPNGKLTTYPPTETIFQKHKL